MENLMQSLNDDCTGLRKSINQNNKQSIIGQFESSENPNFWAMEKWIISEIYDNNGGIYSWQRGDEKGYLYNEITGYGIKLYMYLYDLFKDKKYIQMAQKSVDYINSNIYASSGGISRENVCYVFDTCICLSGILSYCEYNLDKKYIRENMINYVFHNLSNKTPVQFNESNKTVFDFNHWSISYGSHLLKCCIALSQSSKMIKSEKEKNDKLIEKLCLDILPNFHKGHFHINSNSEEVYTHSHCYATEGLIYLNRPEYLHIINESAKWLATVQNSDGSLYNRYFSTKNQEKVADILAQAIRIWLWTDKERFDFNIKKGFGFLRSLQSPRGGIYYKQGSNDVNSWATMFTMNALLWNHYGVDTKWLI